VQLVPQEQAAQAEVQAQLVSQAPLALPALQELQEQLVKLVQEEVQDLQVL
jgi:hypothetical protein